MDRRGCSRGKKFMPSRSEFLTQPRSLQFLTDKPGSLPTVPPEKETLWTGPRYCKHQGGDAVACVPAGCNRMPLTILVTLLLRKW